MESGCALVFYVYIFVYSLFLYAFVYSLFLYAFAYINLCETDGVNDVENGSGEEDKPKLGSAEHLIEVENNRSIKVGKLSLKI